MGPLSTAYLYQRITQWTKVSRDQDHIPIIINSNTIIPDRSAFLTGRGEDPYPYLLKSALFLQQANVDAIIIGCNTAHYWVPFLRKQVQIPIISMIEAVVDLVKEDSKKRADIAILGTAGLQSFPSYQASFQEAGIAAYTLNPEEQDRISSIIYDVKERGVHSKNLAAFNFLIKEMEEKGRHHFILGCTELAYLSSFLSDKEKFINSIDVLAKCVIQYLGYPLRKEENQ